MRETIPCFGPSLKDLLCKELCRTMAHMPETIIARTYYFESAHRLPKLPQEHKCSNMHGHNYKMIVTMRGPLDERGFVLDFAELDAKVLPLVKQADHTVLNEVPGLENPTAELIAAWFLDRIAGAASVRVYENEDCWAEAGRGNA